MRFRFESSRWTSLGAALAAAAFVGLSSVPAYAQSEILDELLEKLKDKGVLSEDEYQALKKAREEERIEQRAERRRQALKQAQDTEKDEKAKEESKTTLKGRFNNGFVLESGDKKNSIGINGRVQADYRQFSPQSISADTFDVRRAYITLSGKVWEDWTFDVTADLAQGTNGGTFAQVLDVAWMNWGRWKEFQIRAGQFKMPFSIEELSSSRFLDFTERSYVNQLVPAKERGLMVHGTPYTGLYYGLALSNGQGKNNNDTNTLASGKDVIGRAVVNIAELAGVQSNAVYHIGAAYSRGNIPAIAAQSGRTEARGVTFFAPTTFGAFDSNIERTRTGFEGSAAYGPVKLQGEWIKVNYAGSPTATTSFDKDITAYYAEAMWLVTGENYAGAYRGGTYGRIVPKRNFDPSSGGWGAWELGLRYSRWDASDFPIQTCGAALPQPTNQGIIQPVCSGATPLTVGTNSAKAYTIGLKWIPTPNTRVYLNYIQTKFDTPIVIRGGNNPGTTAATAGTGAPETASSEKAINLRFGIDF